MEVSNELQLCLQFVEIVYGVEGGWAVGQILCGGFGDQDCFGGGVANDRQE